MNAAAQGAAPEGGMSVAERVAAVQARIAAACARAGRSSDGVALVAVSKTFGPDAVAEAAAAGITLFGENRVQEAAQKIPACSSRLEWHLVGHLQSNKARLAAQLFHAVHSIDSWKVLEALERQCDEAGRDMPVCLQVNVAGEASKFGLAPEAVPAVIDRCGDLRRVSVIGLMTVPPFRPDPEDVRPFFARLRTLRDALRERTGFPLETLSMGMTHDFEVAIEEGATWIRVGSGIFGARSTKKV